MSAAAPLVEQLNQSAKFFRTTISIFEPADAGFSPSPELFTVAGHVAHAADAVEWFVEGAFGKGWNMNFEASIARARAVTSLEEAKAWFDRAVQHATDVIGKASAQRLAEPIPNDAILGGAPRGSVVMPLIDHTAHHRGALAVYARLVGKVPPMPYT